MLLDDRTIIEDFGGCGGGPVLLVPRGAGARNIRTVITEGSVDVDAHRDFLCLPGSGAASFCLLLAAMKFKS
jgi:hypothetical protein